MFIIEQGRKLLITPDKPLLSSSKNILIGQDSEDEITSKIISIYRKGYKSVKISFKCLALHKLKWVVDLLNKFHGIVVEVCSDHINIHDEIEHDICINNIKKCFKNIILMSDYLNSPTKDQNWKNEIGVIYEKTYFLSEYVIRLIHIEGKHHFKQALDDYNVISACQYLLEIVKRIAEYEFLIRTRIFSNNTYYISDLLKVVFSICYGNMSPKNLFLLNNEVKMDISTYNKTPIWECAIILQVLCKNIVMLMANQ